MRQAILLGCIQVLLLEPSGPEYGPLVRKNRLEDGLMSDSKLFEHIQLEILPVVGSFLG